MKINTKIKMMLAMLAIILGTVIGAVAGQINENLPHVLPVKDVPTLRAYAWRHVSMAWVIVYSDSQLPGEGSYAYTNSSFNPRSARDWLEFQRLVSRVLRTNTSFNVTVQFSDDQGFPLFWGNAWAVVQFNPDGVAGVTVPLSIVAHEFVPLYELEGVNSAYLYERDRDGNIIWSYSLNMYEGYGKGSIVRRPIFPYYAAGKIGDLIAIDSTGTNSGAYDLEKGWQVVPSEAHFKVSPSMDGNKFRDQTNAVYIAISDNDARRGMQPSVDLKLTKKTVVWFSSWLPNGEYASTVTITPIGFDESYDVTIPIDKGTHLVMRELGAGQYTVYFDGYPSGWGHNPNGFDRPNYYYGGGGGGGGAVGVVPVAAGK